MDFKILVFYVTGNDRNKVKDESILDYIQKVFDFFIIPFPLSISEPRILMLSHITCFSLINCAGT